MKSIGLNQQQLQKMKSHPGFIAALDQSGGSTPKALALYGVKEGAWSNVSLMRYFQLGNDGASPREREREWNPNLRDRTRLKLPSSECVQRGFVKKLVARACRQFDICDETRVGIDC
jgi:hypothetical protein